MIDFSRRCVGAPFNNQSRTRGVGVPLCSGPSSLVLVQGTEVRILPGLPLILTRLSHQANQDTRIQQRGDWLFF